MKQRLAYVDNLRIFLIALVVLYHAGRAYGPGGWWYFESPEQAGILGPLFTINRSFFMSLFFLLSGYFLPASLERKGPGRYLKDRLLRLGVPLLFFFFLVIPLLTYSYYINFRPYGWMSFGAYYRQVYFGGGAMPAAWTGPAWPDTQVGHLWFLQHLLLYSLGYLLFRMVERRVHRGRWREKPLPRRVSIIVFVLCLSAVTFAVRIRHPIDRWVGVFGFIQTMFADVPRDLSFFIIGLLAGRRGWLDKISPRGGFRWLAAGAGLAVVLTVIAAAGIPVFRTGHLDWRSFAYSVWESLFCLSMCIGLIVFFREKVNQGSPLLRDLAAATFAVYLFHVPVVVGFQHLFGLLRLAPLLGFLVVTVCAVPVSFLLGSLLRKIPGFNRVL